MVDSDIKRFAIGLLYCSCQRRPRCKRLQAFDCDFVVPSNFVVVSRVIESQRQHALLLQVGLVDTSKASGNDSDSAQVPGLQGGVLAAGPLPIVLVAHHHPLHARRLVLPRHVRHRTRRTAQLVGHLVDRPGLRVDGPNEHVVGDVVQVAAVLEPGPGHADVVGGALPLRLDQHRAVRRLVRTVPPLKRVQQGQARAVRADHDLQSGAILRGRLEGVLPRVKPTGGQLLPMGGLKPELASTRRGDGVTLGVEGDGPGEGAGGDQLRRGDEGVGLGVAVVALGKVTVVRGQDGVGLALLLVSVPLADAGPAGVG
mmetsp:Transcript_7113/g.10670  ORF Transcript_7113/g.10670 Transcript_7113/m.10670 type:complete len:313 (-) Transcript_7113:1449-2387(-)